MLCVERIRSGFLPTISEYEPRCPRIVVDLCSSNQEVLSQDVPDCALPRISYSPIQRINNSDIRNKTIRTISHDDSNTVRNVNQEVLSEDVPDCAPARQATVARDTQCNIRGINPKAGKITSESNYQDYDKRDEKSNDIATTKVRGLKECAEQICNKSQQRKTSNNNQSDIRNKTISPSWDTLLSSVYKPNEIIDGQRNIRHATINPNSSALPSISHLPTQGIDNSDIRNKTIRAASQGDSNTLRNLKPSLTIPHRMGSSSLAATEPWKAVVMMSIGDQVRIWAKDSKNLVVEAIAQELCNLDKEDSNDTEQNQIQKSTEHLITIPDQINLDSLMATLSLEGQLIIKEIRQQKPSRGNIVVIPIEKM